MSDKPGRINLMECVPMPSLTDGVVRLRPLTQADAAAHLAGEDEEMAKWLNGGHSTADMVQAAIDRFEEQWSLGGPRRAFGVFDCGSDQLIGFVEVNLELLGDPAEINVSYGIFRERRGRGHAARAIDLISEYLRSATKAKRIILLIAPANARSIRVAEKAGFARVGIHESAEGRRVQFVREL